MCFNEFELSVEFNIYIMLYRDICKKIQVSQLNVPRLWLVKFFVPRHVFFANDAPKHEIFVQNSPEVRGYYLLDPSVDCALLYCNDCYQLFLFITV